MVTPEDTRKVIANASTYKSNAQAILNKVAYDNTTISGSPENATYSFQVDAIKEGHYNTVLNWAFDGVLNVNLPGEKNTAVKQVINMLTGYNVDAYSDEIGKAKTIADLTAVSDEASTEYVKRANSRALTDLKDSANPAALKTYMWGKATQRDKPELAAEIAALDLTAGDTLEKLINKFPSAVVG